ncbi:methyltransferase domain-containing protein, partial [Roseburia faecis]|nr:methyltransferase domain-containing protein [Roseburia faecis]
INFTISPLSFYQVNPQQTEKLYQTAIEAAGLDGTQTVIDAYCGIGTISLAVAKHAKKVYGVEIVPAAIEDAKQNAKVNQIDNAEFVVGKAEEQMAKWQKEGLKPDVLIVDPPRKGLDES